jgi:hypothetical protein
MDVGINFFKTGKEPHPHTSSELQKSKIQDKHHDFIHLNLPGRCIRSEKALN